MQDLTINSPFSKFQRYNFAPENTVNSTSAEDNSKNPENNKKKKLTAPKCAAAFAPVGILHGFYKKYDIDYNSLVTIKKQTVEYLKEKDKYLGVMGIAIKPGKVIPFKKIIVEKDKDGFKPVAVIQLLKEKDKHVNVSLPPIKKKGKTNIIENVEKMEFNCKKSYALFERILSPLDEKIFNKVGKIPFCKKIADFMSNVQTPIKQLQIGNRSLYYNKFDMLKGANFMALVGLTLGLGVKIVQKTISKNKDKEDA